MPTGSLINHGTLSRPYGLILCGGHSSRMGMDKSLLVYHSKPQCYYLYEMMEQFCEKVFISCTIAQSDKFLNSYSTLDDLPHYSNIGPMGALLTAFDKYPGHNFIVIGCDYPFLTSTDIRSFISDFKELTSAAFFNETAGLYEPLLAYYNKKSADLLLKMFGNKEYSLQQFLIRNNATKYYPENILGIRSADTPADYNAAIELLKQRG